MPIKDPAKRKIRNTHAEIDNEAAATKKALMLQPPAMQAPYPIRNPPRIVFVICFLERIFWIFRLLAKMTERNAPKNIPRFRRFGPMAVCKTSGSAWSREGISLNQ